MDSRKDYYQILNLNRDATTEEIKRSYRKLALQYHPDKNIGDNRFEELFKLTTEAYTVLIDPEKRKKYDSERFSESKRQTSNSSVDEDEITPATFLKIFYDIKNTLLQATPGTINSFKLYQTLNDILANDSVKFLSVYASPEMKKMIVNEILICSSFINESSYNLLQPKLLVLAQGNDQLINTVKSYKQKKQNQTTTHRPVKQNSPNDYRGIFFIIVAIAAIFIFAKNVNKSSPNTNQENLYRPQNGNLDHTFNSSTDNTDTITSSTSLEKLSPEEKLISEGWEENYIDNGQMPSCYNFKPRKSSVDNMLEVTVGGGTDVVIKLMNLNTEKCIRYVFINSGTTYQIKNIPEGVYYTKIAYGTNWYSKSENGECTGKFLNNPMYEKGTDIMDFNIQYTGNSYSIPSFQLQLDVISNQNINTFNSQNISENEFND